jgi:hypothetical protein
MKPTAHIIYLCLRVNFEFGNGYIAPFVMYAIDGNDKSASSAKG